MRAQIVAADGVKLYAALPGRAFHIRDQQHLAALRAAGLVIEPPTTLSHAHLDLLLQGAAQ